MDPSAWGRQITLAEGRRNRIYTDTAGKVSGGIGRNLTDNGFRQNEIDLMFSNDTQEVEDDLRLNFPWWPGLDDVRQRAIAEMRFNLGGATFRQFVHMLAAAQVGDWSTCADQVEASEAAVQLPSRYSRIASMIRTGVDPT